MTEEIENARQQAARTKTEAGAAQQAHSAGVQAQAKSVFARQHNPQFYDKFTQSSLFDSTEYSYLADSVETWLADDHILGNRRQVYRQQMQMLNPVRAEQEITGRNPGVRLREKPLLYALANGEHPTLDEPIPLSAGGQSSAGVHRREPITSDERSALHDISRVATSRMSMSVDNAGSGALTTATSEQVTRRDDENEDGGGITSSIGGMFD